MPQPRERQQEDQQRNQQDQSPNKQGRDKKAHGAEQGPEQRRNPDRYPHQDQQPQKTGEGHYPEQDPSGKAERPDAVEGAVEGAEAKPRDRRSWDDLD